MNNSEIEIIQPDDWHIHLREGDILKTVAKYSFRINKRCIVMPNLKIPVSTSILAQNYKSEIEKACTKKTFIPLIPCYLTDNLNIKDFEYSLKNNIFFNAKLYPCNVTTNSNNGVSNLENIYPALEILQKMDKYLLVHGEKLSKEIDIFDREKFFIDQELVKIRRNFPKLKIVLEHVSSKYGADYVAENDLMAGTITPQHMLLTKKDVFLKDGINAHNYCMPIVKEEQDLIALRKYACSGNKKFFLGTDSAPHPLKDKNFNYSSKPGIFSAPCSIELYAEIFDQENSISKLEDFSSINGPNFYNLPINKSKIKLLKQKWKVDEFSGKDSAKIKNFFGGEELNWKVA